MSHKHSKLLAKYIDSILDPHARLQVAAAVASASGEINSRFDLDRFFYTCGVGSRPQK